MIFNKIRLEFVLLVFLFNCISCDFYSESDAKKFLPGKYIYEYPSKEVEILEINSNFEFKQTIFANKKAYMSQKYYLYSNPKGKLEVNKNKIVFDHWLDVTYLNRQDGTSSKPEYTSYTGVYWEKPTTENNVLITIYDQDNYVFKKIGN